MLRKEFRTFRILTYLAQAFFWIYVIFQKAFIGAEIALAFTFTVSTLLWLHGMQVFYLVMKDAEKLPDITEVYEKIKAEELADEVTCVLNHRKLYKALKRLDDIENC